MRFIISGNKQYNVTGTKNWEGGSPWKYTSLKTSWTEHTIVFKLEEKFIILKDFHTRTTCRYS